MLDGFRSRSLSFAVDAGDAVTRDVCNAGDTSQRAVIIQELPAAGPQTNRLASSCKGLAVPFLDLINGGKPARPARDRIGSAPA